jgi:hypothetical protein
MSLQTTNDLGKKADAIANRMWLSLYSTQGRSWIERASESGEFDGCDEAL